MRDRVAPTLCQRQLSWPVVWFALRLPTIGGYVNFVPLIIRVLQPRLWEEACQFA